MADAIMQTSVDHDTGLDAATSYQNLKSLKAAMKAADQAEAQARAQGDQALADDIAAESQARAQAIQAEATTRAQAITGLSNTVTQHIQNYDAKMLLIDQEIEIAKGLNSEERTAVLALIEEGVNSFVNSGGLAAMAARLTVMLDGKPVNLPDAISLLWSKPSVSHTKILSRYADNIAEATEVTFTDGLASVTTSVRDESVAGQITVSYTAANFRGLGIDATATDVVSVDADGFMLPKQYGKLNFTLSVAEGSSISVSGIDFNNDGNVADGDLSTDDTASGDDPTTSVG